MSLVVSLGFWAEANADPGYDSHPSRWLTFFSLSWERNLPTWVSALILFACAVLLLLNALRSRALGEPWTAHWCSLGAIFAYISLDEFTTIHERANSWFDLGGVFYFGWVIPAFFIVGTIGLSYLGFLRALPVGSRVRFVIAGALYVGGALFVELGLGYWTDLEGSNNVGYALIDLLEESMEMSGASLFLVALLRHLAGGSQTLRITAPGVATCGAESKQIRDPHSPGEHSFASAAARFWPALFIVFVAGVLRSRASSEDSGQVDPASVHALCSAGKGRRSFPPAQ